MPWELSREKYMRKDEVRKLRRTLEDRANADLAKGRVSGVKAWMVIDLALSTGLRVSEITALKIEDLELKGKEPLLWVVDGKGRKKKKEEEEGDDQKPFEEPVHLSKALVKHLKEFIKWKETIGEGISGSDFLFVSKRKEPYGTRALQVMFKEACKRAKLSKKYSIHSCRHSYGTYLYQKTKNLRLVMKELRHRNIQTTTVYSDVVPEDAIEGVNGVWEE